MVKHLRYTIKNNKEKKLYTKIGFILLNFCKNKYHLLFISYIVLIIYYYYCLLYISYLLL